MSAICGPTCQSCRFYSADTRYAGKLLCNTCAGAQRSAAAQMGRARRTLPANTCTCRRSWESKPDRPKTAVKCRMCDRWHPRIHVFITGICRTCWRAVKRELDKQGKTGRGDGLHDYEEAGD